MAEFRATFFAECEDLLEGAQAGLLAMQHGRADSETLNVVFRAVHSIKGGAGAFALEEIVAFAHQFETALDQLRTGTLQPDAATILLLLNASDGLSDLVAASRDGTSLERGATDATLADLCALVSDGKADENPTEGFVVTKLSLDLDAPEPPLPERQTYRIDFVPDDALYALGNEPLFLFRALAELGDLEVVADIAMVPEIDKFVPGSSYVGWTLDLTTAASDAEIAEVFDFVDGLCTLRIARVPADRALDPVPCPPPGAQTASAQAPGSAPQEGPVGEPPQTRPEAHLPQASTAAPVAATVRVDLDRIDRLANLVGELVIQQAILTQSIADTGLTRRSTVSQNLEKLTGLTREMQNGVMMIRAQPLKSLFQRMSRIVREASAASGKPVRFSTEGEATEIDKAMIEGLADPLMHMLRNAVDHGLEPPGIRAAAGKSAQGDVRLSAAHRSGRVVIEVTDDGGGIDRAKVLDTAISRGLVSAGAQLSEPEIDSLLFLPGFSTAGEVSNLSGRGVGMDVVRSAIQTLGGRIAIRSETGRGTTFSVSLPLTLAVLDGMIVDVADERLVLPVHTIIETLTLSDDEVGELAPGSSLAMVRGQILALLDLGSALGYRAPLETIAGAQALVIALEGNERVALLVDAIHDQRQVVIKGLRDGFGRAPGVAAATILGDGQVALILDPIEIVAHAGIRAAAPLSSAG
ncbi:MAG: chemotaxis protein CheA [Rhodobacteraceae bacterium]|nr:chemotaxis protein CheA [Paracoccaceae bacterium]